ncbi:MCE-family protein MCE3A [Mycolicibacterium moriokaense]|uniref:MCE-family protein MCE3A n=1 Tax=Mycolicibacterium moriokaense TaxID=39691 RepID=A0AAD1M3X2_9MYCO|nr:MCE family protein [Mycolicibacterium moriokaense]MCV7042457.1 MCE family protein [Mycolicibacterium moriokaense]ORB22948.1 MCE-family protein MCE3A [Mycolicibacterium moriokaense]BBW99130.1 MCE-family protein MCE3A [Mycolicibacterium moriokaense]
MDVSWKQRRIHPIWWTLGLFAVIATIVVVCAGLFMGSFNTYTPVILASDRTGLVMETGAKVKLRGVEVGRVAGIKSGTQPVSLTLEMFPDQLRYIPANVEAEIRATTAFGAKYVDLVYPENPSPKRLAAGQVLQSRNVSTEVNTVFENLVGVLDQIDVAKLNATLTAFADGVRGQGPRIGEATTAANEVLLEINPRMDTVAQDWRSFKGFNDTYSVAAHDILATLNAASSTSSTITSHAKDLDALLLNAIGLSTSATNLLGANKDNLVQGINELTPTTDLLLKYNPVYTCMLQGAKFFLDNGGYENIGGNGKSIILDAAILLGDDPYKYPENLPIVAAKGGPGGKPSCGSLPDVRKNFPVRKLITNTGWGTGLDWRPNPGIGHPWYVDYFPVTRAVPEPPSVRGEGPPAIGPVPYPGAPPYGAPLYGPGGVPLYPGVPPAPPPPQPSP